MVLWVGSIGALLGTVMLSAGSIGRNLPAGAEKHGKWAGMAAGVLMLLAVLVWWLLLPDTDADTSAGMGVWMTVLGGVLGVVAGVLAYFDQK
jgi:dolichyl-phosphate-mannose--protein O-mannosyl transferase